VSRETVYVAISLAVLFLMQAEIETIRANLAALEA
jgi:hypothetical protein